MRHLFKEHIKNLNRYQTSTGRDLEGLRLDRNERVDPMEQKLLEDILSKFTPAQFAAHPESDFLYPKLADFIQTGTDNLYIVNGITEGIGFLFSTLCTSEHNVVVLDPTYPMYAIYAALNDVEYRRFTYGDNLKPDWETLEDAIDSKTAFVIVANPNLPVESAFDKIELQRLAELCKEKGCGLVVDEAYHHFGAESAIGLIKNNDHIVIFRTFSKAFGLASIRLGVMISCQENIQYLSKTRSIVEANTLSMGIAGYMLDHRGIMYEHVKQVKEGAVYLQSELDKEGLRWHGGDFTNGLLVFLDGIGSPDEVIAVMRKNNIYIRGAFAPPFDQCIRISIGSKNSMEQFMAIFKGWLSQ